VNILGPDFLVFGIDDLDAGIKCAEEYGLRRVEHGRSGATYEAMDGTGIVMRLASDLGLAPATASTPNLRETIYGVADTNTLQAIGAELSKDREVKSLPNGIVRSTDDDGYFIAFQVTTRRRLSGPHYGVNVPWQPPGRPLNYTAADNVQDIKPCSLSHVVMFTKDKEKSEKFYAQRLGFRTVDAFTNLGPFMRPAGTKDHHTLFLIQAPVVGVEHFTFHFAGANEVLKGGWEFSRKGYKSFWGPGRHIFGSNYFWYFRSPFGGNIEFDADMDTHDDSWKPRYVSAAEDSTQTFLLQYADKWVPTKKP
jgi:catechol 2,3-dioxygenase-like lactoylglutathione lyase family enzyme